MIDKRWTYLPIDREHSEQLQAELNTNPILCDLLVQRGIFHYDQAKAFFRPNVSDLHDPFLMKDMKKASDRVIQAIENQEIILIIGDYDVDGTTSTALLTQFFKSIGGIVHFYIPNRYSEGYGVSMKSIEHAREINASLIITIDCGITAIEPIKKATEYGIDAIICDHHLPSDKVPNAIAILDPKQTDDNYPYNELSGCGVGFKLCSAVAKVLHLPEDTYMQYLDLVVVSIACDIVPITGENRILAYYGLQKLNEKPCIGLKVLMEKLGWEDKELDISNIVFGLGPKINAPGRMEQADASVHLLMSENEEEADHIIDSLIEHNDSRKEADLQILQEAIAIIDETPEAYENSIVLYNKNWSKGVIGIVASRLVDRYYKPTIILSEKDDVLTGSARSIKGFNIYDGIKSCSEFIVQYGGHEYAAGLTLEKKHYDLFRHSFDKIASTTIAIEDKMPEVLINRNITLADVTIPFYRLIRQMAPFGPENMQPIFSTEGVYDNGNTKLVGHSENHIKFDLRDENNHIRRGIAFNLGEKYKIEDIKSKKMDICFTLQLNEFKGREYLDLFIKDIKIHHE